MGNAFLVGGGSASGIREKSVTYEEYQALPDDQKNNPYIIWLVKDKSATDYGGANAGQAKTKIALWETYKALPTDEQLDPSVVWIISDKNLSDMVELGYGVNESQGSKLYNIAADTDIGILRATVETMRTQITELTQTNNILAQEITDLRKSITANQNALEEHIKASDSSAS